MQRAHPVEDRRLEGQSPGGKRPLAFYLRVLDCDTGTVLGHLVDASTGSLLLISEAPVEPRRDFSLEIPWHDANGQQGRIRFRAQSGWQRHHGGRPVHVTSFQLVDSPVETLDAIRSVMRDLSVRV